MRILIDIQTLYTNEKNRGIGKFTKGWLKSLITQNDQHRYYLMRKRNGRWQFSFISQYLDLDERLLIDCLWEDGTLENFIKKNDINVIHFTSPLMLDIEVPQKIDVKVKKSYLVYDLIPFIFKNQYYDKWPVNLQKEYDSRIKMIKEADLILTISESTKNDLISYLKINKDKIDVIYASVNSALLDLPANRTIYREYKLTGPFIFSLTGVDWRKNNEALVSAFSEIANRRPEYKFVIAGISQDNERNKLKALGKSKGLGDKQLYILNHIPDDSLIALYKDCDAFVFASLYEGFGMPVIEAMSYGTPVVASNNSSLPEVIGDAGILVNPYDTNSIVNGVMTVINEKEALKEMREKSLKQAKEFSWASTALKSLNAYHKIMGNSTVTVQTRAKKPVLAFFSPLQPQSSGISDYSERLLMYLKEFFEIKVFVSDFYPSNPKITDYFQILDYKKDKKMLEGINLRLYHMGNSTFHDWIYEAIKAYPGIIVLHDLNLFGFHKDTKLSKNKEKEFIDEITYCHGMAAKKQVEQMKRVTYGDVLNFPMFKKAVELSNGIIAHSAFVKTSILSSINFKGEIKVIPMGTDIREVNRERIIFLKKKLGLNSDHIAIGVYGRVHPYKRVDVIIRSFAKLIVKNQKLDLFVIGFCHSSIKGSLANLAKSLNIDRRVHFISSPITDDLHTFNRYIESIDICVNLRSPTMGETSATLITALGFGKPCIVTNAGSYREYPDDFVWKVDADHKYEEELLTAYLHALCSNTALREKMSKMAFDYMWKNHHQTIWSIHYKDFILDQKQDGGVDIDTTSPVQSSPKYQ